MGSDLSVQRKQAEPVDGKGQTSFTEDQRPVFQEIARYRSIVFDAKLKPYGITMSQGWVLVHLWRENGLRQLEIAKRMDVATVTVSKLIDRLEAHGFVERRANELDRRSNRIFATKLGRDLVKTMSRKVLEVDSIANTGISEDELAVTMSVLTRMRDNLKKGVAQR